MHLASRPTSSAPTSGELDAIALFGVLNDAAAEIRSAASHAYCGTLTENICADMEAAVLEVLRIVQAERVRRIEESTT